MATNPSRISLLSESAMVLLANVTPSALGLEGVDNNSEGREGRGGERESRENEELNGDSPAEVNKGADKCPLNAEVDTPAAEEGVELLEELVANSALFGSALPVVLSEAEAFGSISLGMVGGVAENVSEGGFLPLFLILL